MASFFTLSFFYTGLGPGLGLSDASLLSVFLNDFFLTIVLSFVGEAEALSRLFYRYRVVGESSLSFLGLSKFPA